MQSFLHVRSHQVCVQGSLSTRGMMTVGVSQGSILGPLLFSLYVNDLPTAVKEVDVNLYADGTELHCYYLNFEELEIFLQSALTQLFVRHVAN